MPSSFTRDHSSALGFSPRLPVSVYGTVSVSDTHRGFSWQRRVSSFVARRPRGHASGFGMEQRIYLPLPPTRFNPHIQWWACLSSCVTPGLTLHGGTGILTCFPSTTHFCLALGADSPCVDERCAGNLGLTASGPFTRFIATHVSIRTSDTSSSPHEPPSQAYGTLSYHHHPPKRTVIHSFGARFEPRYIFRAGRLDQ